MAGTDSELRARDSGGESVHRGGRVEGIASAPRTSSPPSEAQDEWGRLGVRHLAEHLGDAPLPATGGGLASARLCFDASIRVACTAAPQPHDIANTRKSRSYLFVTD